MSQKLRVLMFSDYFYPHVGGGVEKVVYELSKRLVKMGCDVLVITLGEKCLCYDVDGIKVYRAAGIDLTKLFQMQLSIPKDIKNILNVTKDFSPDIIHAHNIFFTTSLLAVLIKHISHQKLVFSAHLGDVGNLALLGRWKALTAKTYEKIFGKIILSSSDVVIAVSHAVRQHVISLGAPPKRVIVVPNGVDLEEFSMPFNTRKSIEPDVIFVGRLIPNKGLEYLIEAAKILIRSGSTKIRFKIVGDGPYRQQLEELVTRYGLSPYFEFLGFVPKVSEILRNGGIFVRPSLTEGMPLTILEAMASGLPIIATRVSGTAEIVIHNETGILVEPGNVEQLAEAIKYLVESPDEALRLGWNARAFIERHYREKFSWDAAASNVLSVYESLR
ncbi:MAG: glycosyltransferase family 4 protein [Candidatus Bathyarchaeia archaeon]